LPINAIAVYHSGHTLDSKEFLQQGSIKGSRTRNKDRADALNLIMAIPPPSGRPIDKMPKNQGLWKYPSERASKTTHRRKIPRQGNVSDDPAGEDEVS